jgi:hypothetical protein
MTSESHAKGPPPARYPFTFVPVGKMVMNGNLRVCEASSQTMAIRIAKALNAYTASRRGT